MEQELDLLDVKIDYAFKRIFGENEDIFINFTNSILNQPHNKKIKSVQFLNTEVNQESAFDKESRFDVLAQLNDGSFVNMEMQMSYTSEYEKRCLYYWTKLYEQQMFKGDRYKNLQPAICINILNYKYFKEKENYITELRVVDIETKNIFTQDFQIFLIEVPKALKESYTELSKWMRFLKGASREEIFSMDNPFILKAQEKLEYLSQDFQARIQYNSRQKYLHDYMSDTASKFEEGMEKGINIGVEKGEYKNKLENAKNFLQLGVSIDIISKATGLTREEIEKLA